MPPIVYRYQFAASVPLEDVERAIVVAIRHCESLYGPAQVRLDAGHVLDEQSRTVVIDAQSIVGQAFNQLFVGRIQRKYKMEDFSVERITQEPGERVT